MMLRHDLGCDLEGLAEQGISALRGPVSPEAPDPDPDRHKEATEGDGGERLGSAHEIPRSRYADLPTVTRDYGYRDGEPFR